MSKRSSILDVNQIANSVVEKATENAETISIEEIHKVMSALGRKGGKIGGKRSAENLSDERLKAIAKKGAEARWAKKPNDED